MKQVTVFTDGGAERSTGVGGYGVVLRFGDSQKELAQGFRHTTSNRMELLAAVIALETLKEPCKVLLHSDSRYLVDSVNTGAVFRWRQKGWNNGKEKDADLWERFILAYASHDVEMLWVKGHAGVADNERCDQLATQAMMAEGLLEDAGHVNANQRTPKVKKRKSKKKVPHNDSPKESSGKEPCPEVDGESAAPTTRGKNVGKPKQAGDPCRDCGRPLIRRTPKKSNAKSSYYFEWYLYCESCKKLFHVEEAKVYRNKSGDYAPSPSQSQRSST